MKNKNVFDKSTARTLQVDFILLSVLQNAADHLRMLGGRMIPPQL